MRVANLISFSWICLRFDLYSFSSSESSFFSFGVMSSPFSFLVSLTFSLLLMTVSKMSLAERPEALDLHDRFERLGVVEDLAQRVVVDVDQQSRLPLAGEQRRGRAGHGDVEDAASVDLGHVRAVVGEHGQEAHQVLDRVLRVGCLRRQPGAVVGDLAQRPGRREVEDEADRLEDLLLVRVVAVRVLDRPRRLHAERGLEVRLRRLEVAQHQDRRPLRDRDAGRELAAGERDGLRVVPVADRFAHGGQRGQPDPGAGASDSEHLVVVEEDVLLLSQQVRHRVT